MIKNMYHQKKNESNKMIKIIKEESENFLNKNKIYQISPAEFKS